LVQIAFFYWNWLSTFLIQIVHFLVQIAHFLGTDCPLSWYRLPTFWYRLPTFLVQIVIFLDTDHPPFVTDWLHFRWPTSCLKASFSFYQFYYFMRWYIHLIFLPQLISCFHALLMNLFNSYSCFSCYFMIYQINGFMCWTWYIVPSIGIDMKMIGFIVCIILRWLSLSRLSSCFRLYQALPFSWRKMRKRKIIYRLLSSALSHWWEGKQSIFMEVTCRCLHQRYQYYIERVC
jgi:hypothetical protein